MRRPGAECARAAGTGDAEDKSVSVGSWDRAVYLLALGVAWSGWPLVAAPAWAQGPRGTAADGRAARMVTAEDVEHILENGRPDAELARRLAGVALTERLGEERLERLEKRAPGAKSRTALVALADAAEFLPPARADVAAEPEPDLAEQRHILALTVDYVGKTLPRLPNFYATEATVRYEGKAMKPRKAGAAQEPIPGWRAIGRSKVVVTYRNGKEVVAPPGWGKHRFAQETNGLMTRGTFGPILSTVIVDAAHGEMTWSRWERSGDGALAVFRYRVPQEQSHYSVALHGDYGEMGFAEQVTGYHGEVAVDAATGTIRRVTVEADPRIGSPIVRGDILVEYGPVEIGGRTYTCPVRSVSISVQGDGLGGGMSGLDWPGAARESTLLNDVRFEDYHLFRAQMQILTGAVPGAHR